LAASPGCLTRSLTTDPSTTDSTTIKLEADSSTSRSARVPALTVLSHPAMSRAGERALLEALAAGEEVAISRMGPELRRRGQPAGAPLEDPFVSRRPFTLAPGRDGGVLLRVGEDGTSVSVGLQPVRGELALGPEAIARGVPLVLCQRIVLLLHVVELDGYGPEDQLGLVGESAGLRQVRQQIRNVMDLDVPVLVRGETGTGKEQVARALHENGSRRHGTLVPVNLAAIPKDLAAAELFGVKRGAFTGADRDREGLFQRAHGGTLFLDEVGEAPPEVQVMLLRVLESGDLFPVGGVSPVKLDVRLVAATDADLEARMRAGQFRAPLLHRLAGYEIHLPPLRERLEDIGLLFAHFARQELEKVGEVERLAPANPRAEPWLPANLALALLGYSWPGNVRELRNKARQLIISNRGRPSLAPDARLARELGLSPAPDSNPPKAPEPRRKPSDVSRDELVAALRACEWEQAAAAIRLGLPRSSVHFLIEKYRVRTAGDLTTEEIIRAHQELGGKLGVMASTLEVSRPALRRRAKELGLELDES